VGFSGFLFKGEAGEPSAWHADGNAVALRAFSPLQSRKGVLLLNSPMKCITSHALLIVTHSLSNLCSADVHDHPSTAQAAGVGDGAAAANPVSCCGWRLLSLIGFLLQLAPALNFSFFQLPLPVAD